MHKDTLKWIEAINQLVPGAGWSISNDDPSYETLVWSDDRPEYLKPTKQAILDKIAEIDSLEYRKLREKEYPSIGDQLDALFHAGVFPEEMAVKIQAIKDKYPKV